MKNIPATLILLLACASAHAAAPAASEPNAAGILAIGLVMALLSIRYRRRTHQFK